MMAITFCNPLDVVKTRLQLQEKGGPPSGGGGPAYTGVSGSLRRIYQREGARGLQKGLTAVYLLQFTNVGTRFGGYGYIKSALGMDAPPPTTSSSSSTPSPTTGTGATARLFAAGAASGALAGVVSNPFYLLKSRMQASEAVAAADTRTLREVARGVHAEGGLAAFWRGCRAFAPRTAAASSVQLAVYDLVKPRVRASLGLPEGFRLHFVASWITGIAVVLAMQPFDFAATRIMTNPAKYKSLVPCVRMTVAAEGPLALYQGTLANYLRFGPYCVLVFVFTEQLKLLYRERFDESGWCRDDV